MEPFYHNCTIVRHKNVTFETCCDLFPKLKFCFQGFDCDFKKNCKIFANNNAYFDALSINKISLENRSILLHSYRKLISFEKLGKAN